MTNSNVLKRTLTLVLVIGAAILAPHAEAARRADTIDSDPGSCLVLEWMDPHELLPAGERWIAKETTRILGAAEISSRWDWSETQPKTRMDAVPEHRLRVVLLPSEPSGPGWGLTPNTLGTTVLDGVSAPPAVYVFYRSVVSLLNRRALSQDPSDPLALGPTTRVLGRVVAHEVAHALAPAEPHARSGLMQAGLTPSFLTSKNAVAIDAQWQRVLGNGLSQLCSANDELSER